LGIGDWAQSPIPNPQSPLFNIKKTEKNLQIYIIIHTKYIKVKYKI